MTDLQLLELAQEAGWSGCDPAVREKLIAFGKLVVRYKNRGNKENMKKFKTAMETKYVPQKS